MEQHPQAPSATTSVTVTVPLVSGESQPQHLEGDLVFDPSDPYAVRLHVRPVVGPPVTWTFARELLAEGLFDPTGDGDVLVWPCLGTEGEAVVVIELRSPSGMAMLQTPSRAIQSFVTDIFELVPAGGESRHISIDALVAHLLAD